MDKAEAIERLEYLKAKAQRVLEQKISEWIAADIRDTVEAYDMAIKALQTEPNSSEKPNNCEELNAYRECVKSRSFWDNKHCDGCYFDERCPFDEPKDEPQTDCAWK